MNLHDRKEDFKQLIEDTSQYLSINPAYIEKDYFICMKLKALAESPFKDVAIFKGGTSLSKAHKLINRFSEDIDIAVITDSLSSEAQKDKLVNQASKFIEKNNPGIFTDVSDNREKHGILRRTRSTYPKFFEPGNPNYIKNEIQVEVNRLGDPRPFILCDVQSYIGEFLSKKGAPGIADHYGLQSFKINAMDPSRTVAEKLSSLFKKSFATGTDDVSDKLKLSLRHVYDLSRLLTNGNMKESVTGDGLKNLLAKVAHEDFFNNKHPSFHAWCDKNFTDAIIFNPEERKNIDQKLAAYYDLSIRPITFGVCPDYYQAIKIIDGIIPILREFDREILPGIKGKINITGTVTPDKNLSNVIGYAEIDTNQKKDVGTLTIDRAYLKKTDYYLSLVPTKESSGVAFYDVIQSKNKNGSQQADYIFKISNPINTDNNQLTISKKDILIDQADLVLKFFDEHNRKFVAGKGWSKDQMYWEKDKGNLQQKKFDAENSSPKKTGGLEI